MALDRHPETRLTHPFCDDCWFQWNHEELDDGSVNLREPVRFVSDKREWEWCCGCGQATFSGIYVHYPLEAEEVTLCPNRSSEPKETLHRHLRLASEERRN